MRRIFNLYRNEHELTSFIRGEKSKIIQEFAPDEYKTTPHDQFTTVNEYTNGETHNGGQVPAKVIFKIGTQEIFSVMYKPRSAEVDAKVQQLLAALGVASIKIIPYPALSKSIWQYIDGNDMSLSEEDKEELMKSLRKAVLPSQTDPKEDLDPFIEKLLKTVPDLDQLSPQEKKALIESLAEAFDSPQAFIEKKCSEEKKK